MVLGLPHPVPFLLGTPAGGGLVSSGPYLDTTKGTISTPDAADLNITSDFRITAKFRDDSAEAAAARYLAYKGSGVDLAYGLLSTFASAFYGGLGWPSGGSGSQINVVLGIRTTYNLTPPGLDVYRGADFVGWGTTSDPTLQATGLKSNDGVTWTPQGSPPAPVAADGFNRDSAIPLVLGLGWLGRIYWVQVERLWSGLPNNDIVWRFDANDYPGAGLTYGDPRGRTWTLSIAGAIVPQGESPTQLPGPAPETPEEVTL